MVLVPAKTTKRKTTVAQASPAKKTKTSPAKKAPAAKAKAGAKKGSPNKNNTEDEEEEVEEQTEEVEEDGSENEEGGENEEGDEEGGEGEENEGEGGEEGDETENPGDVTAESEAEAKPEVVPSPIKKGNGPSKLESYVFQNLNPHTSIADVHRVLKSNNLDTGIVNASIIVEFKPNVPKNFLENAAKVYFGGDNEKFTIGKFKPLEIAEYIDNIPPPSVNFKQWLKISVLDLEEGTTKEEVKEIVENIVGEEVRVDTGTTTSVVVTFQSEKSFGKLLIVDDLKVKDKVVRLKIPFVTNISRNSNRRSDFSPRKNGVSNSPVRGGRGGGGGGGGGFGGGRGGGGGGFYGGQKRGRGSGGRMGGGYGGYPAHFMRPY